MATEKQKVGSMRKEAITFLYARGYSFRQIAKVFRMTHQNVFKILKKKVDKNKKTL